MSNEVGTELGLPRPSPTVLHDSNNKGFGGLFVHVAFGVSLPQRSYPDENHGPAPATIVNITNG